MSDDRPAAVSAAPEQEAPAADVPAARPRSTCCSSRNGDAGDMGQPVAPAGQSQAPESDRPDAPERLRGLVGVVARASAEEEATALVQGVTAGDGLAHRLTAIVLTAVLVIGLGALFVMRTLLLVRNTE